MKFFSKDNKNTNLVLKATGHYNEYSEIEKQSTNKKLVTYI
jgi:hypothetical protein